MSDFDEPLSFRLNETWTLAGTAYNPDGTVLNLTGATLTFTASVIGGDAVFTTTAFSIISAAAGTWRLVLHRAARLDGLGAHRFAERVYDYEIKVLTAEGATYHLNAGNLTLSD